MAIYFYYSSLCYLCHILSYLATATQTHTDTFQFLVLDDIFTLKVPNFTEAVKLGLIDLKTGMYHDPQTGRKMFLAEAVKKGLIDTTGEMPLVGDDVSSYTLSQAIELGIFDEVTGKMSRHSATPMQLKDPKFPFSRQ